MTLMACLNQVFTVTVTVWLGGRPNITKTQLAFPPGRTLTQSLFIGILSDSLTNRVSPAPARVEVIRHQAASLLKAHHQSRPVQWGEIRQLVARIISCARVHMMAGFLTVRMSMVHRQFPSGEGSTRRVHTQPIPPAVFTYVSKELRHWARMPADEAWRPASYSVPSATVVVDASTYRMAMHGRSQNLEEFFFSAPMSPDEREASHNAMEMLSVTRGVPVLIRDEYMQAGAPLAPVCMAVLADNVTAVQAMNRMVTNSLFIADQMVPFVRWQAANHFWAVGHYHRKELMDSQRAKSGPGVGMTTDEASRTYGGLWSRAIPMQMFDQICTHFGILKVKVVDMLACCQSTRAERFVSKLPDIQNLWTNALNPLFPWDHRQNPHLSEDDILYCFPSPKMIDRTLDRMEHTSNYVLLVARCDSRLPARLLQSQQGFPPMTFGLEITDMVAPEGPSAPRLSGERMTLLASPFSPPSSLRRAGNLRPSGQLLPPNGPQSLTGPSQGSTLSPALRRGRIGSQARGMVYSTFPDKP